MKAMGWAVVWLAGLGLATLSHPVFSQDSSCSPTTRTPDHIETRTVITHLPYTIAASGSYCLTKDLTGTWGHAGIIIQVDNVILDLSGFALIGEGGSNGVFVATENSKNIAIQNGTIRDWFGDGVDTTNATDCLLDRLHTDYNANCGLNVGLRTAVKLCTAKRNGRGITTASGCILTDCTAQNNSPGDGFNVGTGCVISRCASTSNSSAGIRVTTACILSSCTAISNDGGGIIAGPANQIQDCTAAFNGVADISTDSDNVVTGFASTTNASAGPLSSNNYATTNGNAVPDFTNTYTSIKTDVQVVSPLSP
jgi:hypothetical protein